MSLSVTYTIGPKFTVENYKESLKKYARLFVSEENKKTSEHIKNLVKGIIEGEIRAIASRKHLEKILQEEFHINPDEYVMGFSDQSPYQVQDNIQRRLDEFGLSVWIDKISVQKSENVQTHERD